MINDDKDLIAAMKQIRLSEAARERMRANLSAYADMHAMPSGNFRDFEVVGFVLSVFARSRPIFAGAFAVVLIASTGAGAALAAEQAIPGEVLYGVKVHVNEPVASVFAGSGEAKARYHAKLAVRRVEEAQLLEEKGVLTPELETDLAERFEAETMKAVEVAEKLADAGDISAPIAIRAELAENPVVERFVAAAVAEDATTATLAVADEVPEGMAPEVATMKRAEGGNEPVEARAMMATMAASDTEATEPPEGALKKAAPEQAMLEAPQPSALRVRVLRALALLDKSVDVEGSTAPAPEAVAAVQIARPKNQTASRALLTGASVSQAAREFMLASTTASSTPDRTSPAFDPALLKQVGREVTPLTSEGDASSE